jgi:hypothetical protein
MFAAITPSHAIITLKLAVGLVTVLYIAAIIALLAKKPKWHGRINTVFFLLTMVALIGFEIVIRIIFPDMTSAFSDEAMSALRIHLCFALPSALVLPLMMVTGIKRLIKLHIPLAIVFTLLWAGTFITGIFYLPHDF